MSTSLRSRTVFLVTIIGAACSVGAPAAALAHGEQLLYVFGSWFLLINAGIVALVAWRVPRRLKLPLFAVLLASIGFLMVFPQSLSFASGLEAFGAPGLVFVAAGVPMLVCFVAYLVLKRLLHQR